MMNSWDDIHTKKISLKMEMCTRWSSYKKCKVTNCALAIKLLSKKNQTCFLTDTHMKLIALKSLCTCTYTQIIWFQSSSVDLHFRGISDILGDFRIKYSTSQKSRLSRRTSQVSKQHDQLYWDHKVWLYLIRQKKKKKVI